MEIYNLTAHALAGMLKNRKVSSVEITKSVIDRIEAVETAIGAYIYYTPELALKTAREVDEKIAKDELYKM